MRSEFTPLTDSQWLIIKEFLNVKRKRQHCLRLIFDAILYLTQTGQQWRSLAQTKFPHWRAVYYYFDQWKANGTFAQINLALNQIERLQIGRNPLPSLGLADAQSVKLTPMIYEHRGLDGNKKVNGRKRQIMTDTRGRIYAVHVHAANRYDGPQGIHLLPQISTVAARLEKIIADKAYRGKFAQAVRQMGVGFEVPSRDDASVGFVIEAKRWVVERTFAWFNFYRRLIADYEHTVESSATFVILANISMVLHALE